MTEKQIVRINESKLRNIIAENVRKTLKEFMDTNGDYVPKLKPDVFYVKCVECYNEDDDIVFVAAVTPNGDDNIAGRNVQSVFPDYEIIDMTDVDGVVEIGDMTGGQEKLYRKTAMLLGDQPIYSVDDLDW